MTKWQPTCELRFVERQHESFIKTDKSGWDTFSVSTTKVLQQKWERYESEWYEGKPEIEWRDVPLEEE